MAAFAVAEGQWFRGEPAFSAIVTMLPSKIISDSSDWRRPTPRR
jgi:hypothetical protein